MNTAWSYNYDHALYVNKALLNELNGGVMPETLDEMFDLAINAADAGHQGIGFQNSWWLNQFIAAYTNSFELIIKDGKLLPNFYDENMTPFLAKIAKLVNKSALYINADNVDNFKTGDMLFCLDGLGAWDTSDKLRPIQNVLPSADRMMMPEGPFGSVQISNTGSFMFGDVALNCLRDSGDETKNGKILELYNYLLSPEGLELQVFGVKGTDWDYNAAGNREYKAGISSSLGGMLNDFMQAFIHQVTGLAIARDNPSLQALDYFYDRYNAGLNGTTTPFGIGITEEFNNSNPALSPYYGVRDKWINGILNGSLTVEDLPDMNTELYGDFYNQLVQQLSLVYNSKITSNTDVTGVEIDIKSVSIKVGVAPLQLTATVTPATALNRGVFWTSSDKSIATVDYTGKVTAIKQGEAVITATAIDGKSISQCNVVILPPFTLGSYKASSNNVITNVNPGTTTQEFNNQVLPVGTTTVFNAPLAPVGKVGTGATVDITLNSYTTTYTIKIYGDVSGDGAINLTDLTNIKQHLLKLTSLTGTFKDAGDISKKGSISISDLLAVKKDLLGISPINQNP